MNPGPLPHRLLVFDWDGTLVDSVATIVQCTQTTLRELGLEPVAEGKIRSAIGLGLRQTVERFAPGCDEALFRRIVEVYRRHWITTFRRRVSPFPGVRRLLRELAGEGYALALATAKGRLGLQHDLQRTGLEGHFCATRTVDEAPSKPHPGMLLDILREVGIARERALMIGDTVHDLEMARNAGVGAVGVLSGTEGRDRLEPLAPLVCLESVTELPGWLRNRASYDRAVPGQ